MARADHRTPVIVSGAQVTERIGPATALDLAERAAAACLGDAPGLQGHIDRLSVVNIMSGAGTSPAAELARRLRLSPSHTEVSTIGGNSPQWLVSRAAADIAHGSIAGALVVGAEAQHSVKAGLSAGARRDDGSGGAGGDHTDLAPDPVVGDDRVGVSTAEVAAGILAPVHVYALFESVLAARAGRSNAQQRAVLGHRMARFTEVAAAHPCAWFSEARHADELATVSDDNRLVAEPYPKRMCAFLHVDQAAAVLVTSLGAARSAGLAERAVFCWSAADAADVWFPTARPDPGSSPGMRAAADAAFGAAGIGVDDVGAFDVYSCFPCVVEMATDALGLHAGDTRDMTVTGGLPYFGGPGNNYSLHAIATMADHVHRHGGIGMVSALGWYATKHAVGVYGATPPPHGWRRGDTTGAQRVIDDSAVPTTATAEGPAVVVASTVVPGRAGGVQAAPVIARIADGRHVAAAAHPDALDSLEGRSLVGERVVLADDPPRYRPE
jgi:acetyl-CoA C-acetyltransferase